MTYYLKSRRMADTEEILTWEYEDPYSFYNNTYPQKAAAIRELTETDMAFSVYDEKERLIGTCEFYDIGDDGDVLIAMGVQMKPCYTGKGLGYDFCRCVIDEALKRFHLRHLDLAVAAFNQRAIRVYERLGFTAYGGDLWEIRGKQVPFIYMEKNFDQ